MKKLFVILAFVMIGTMAPVTQTQAQIPIVSLIKAAIKKVIKAIDLQVQRLQNSTIWLQEAQKTLENSMSKMKLDDIGDWVKKQKDLYHDYYEELSKVKSIIAYYQRIKDIAQKQSKLVDEYKHAWSLFQSDKNFSLDELAYMQKVYSGIMDQSSKNIDQITLVINSFSTQMTDAKRLEIINAAADKVDENYYDLTSFNQQNIRLSLQRAKVQNDVDEIKKFYGIQ